MHNIIPPTLAYQKSGSSTNIYHKSGIFLTDIFASVRPSPNNNNNKICWGPTMITIYLMGIFFFC